MDSNNSTKLSQIMSILLKMTQPGSYRIFISGALFTQQYTALYQINMSMSLKNIKHNQNKTLFILGKCSSMKNKKYYLFSIFNANPLFVLHI